MYDIVYHIRTGKHKSINKYNTHCGYVCGCVRCGCALVCVVRVGAVCVCAVLVFAVRVGAVCVCAV